MKKYFAIGFLMVALVLILPTFVKAENVSVSPSVSASINTNTSAENLMVSSQQKLSQLLEQINKLQAELSRLQGEVVKVGEQIEKLTRLLKLGSEGKEVETLQKFLKQDPEIYPEGKVTGYYGPLTEKAVKKFQQKNGIESVGAVGPITMTRINESIEKKEESKITICHIPDGNTANKKTIAIGKSAWEAHLAHGDIMGTCPGQPISPIACTTDAKLCSNGSYVSRTGPNCEFTACPTSQYYINVVSPNGGETWTTGSLQYIKWSSNLPATHKIITVRLRDSYGREHDLLSNGTLNDGIEQITVPTSLATGAYLFEIKTFLENQTVFDKSDATFNITSLTPTPAPVIPPAPTSCSESWSCGNWSSCVNSTQTRTCTDTNYCGTTNARPTLSQSCTPTPTITEITPRIMYWWGKVNQHTDANGNWLTDPDGVSGADLDKLTYCKKFYPNTVSVEDYMLETTNTWLNRGNVDGPFTSTKMSTKCLQPSVSTISTNNQMANVLGAMQGILNQLQELLKNR